MEDKYTREGLTQYTGHPRVVQTGRGAYVIAGTDYGYLHTREGFVRTWRTYGGAYSFLRRHFSGSR
jgi:hypothetical protein